MFDITVLIYVYLLDCAPIDYERFCRWQTASVCYILWLFCHISQPDNRPERRRSMIGRNNPNIQQNLADEPVSKTSYMSAISSIHQDADISAKSK